VAITNSTAAQLITVSYLSRTGERVTVLTTQTVTTLTVAVPSSGTLYGYTAGSVGAGLHHF